MFTGIIGAMGLVVARRVGHLSVESADTARRLAPGGSVAVNGVCLTVTRAEGDRFHVDAVPETLRRTNLGRLEPGDAVNLELPLRLDQGLDGHLVQGHVDGTARVVRVAEVELGREVDLELPDGLSPYVAEKGSIAVDGISLTVAAIAGRTFTVALIPETLRRTIAGRYRPGSLVNVEVDVVARYVRRLMNGGAA
jgi:riboflavin synthase